MLTPRVPLGAIDVNIIRRQLVTLFTRGYIDKGAVSGQSATSLDRELERGESIIRKTLKLNPLRIDGITQPRSSKPSVICSRSIRRLLRVVRHKPTLTYAQVKTKLMIT
jgi:hypothetical protein